ncbi:hypothetical protein PCC7424_5690 (plasmid) [Gloeothece citriformis PCC 7424]|uniref:Uncharacterized protein n=1 Tax=Gloeothece citriformis (strain PCC 7424) TaxID=65393 RepID=B7KLT5_GLOC7|nr:hypothetical protein [Gloeothece citriformis]ACK73757.1 hypothetical protein PCC7424_5690 [Gloeothece citriformis PCC 7424]
MLAQIEASQSPSVDCPVDNSQFDLNALINEKTQQLITDKIIKEQLETISVLDEAFGQFFENLVKYGEIKENLQNKCDAIADVKARREENFPKDEYSKGLYKAIIQSTYPNSFIEELLNEGFEAMTWYKSSLAYTGAEAVQSKLDLLELGQKLGEYKVSQRLISGTEEHPIYLKVLTLTNRQISSSEWSEIEKQFERLVIQRLIETAPNLEKFQQECRKLASANGRPRLIPGLVEAWTSDVLTVISKHYSPDVVTTFEKTLKPGAVELKSLTVDELLELERLIDGANTFELPSVTTVVDELQSKLRSPLNWPLSLIALLGKFVEGIVKKRPRITDKGAFNFTPWKSHKLKVIKGQKLRGEHLALRVEEDKHWDKLQERLNLSQEQFKELHTRVWDLAQEKQDDFKNSREGLGRPIGKIKGRFVPIPWLSDVLEVLPALGIEGDALALVPYDLGVYVEEVDYQIVFSKYKLDYSARTLLKSKVDELAVANDRPVDPITGKVRAWKDDLYQAIVEFGKNASKLLKKEVMRYSVEEVEKLVRHKTAQVEEMQQKLDVTEQRLTEEQTYREQLQRQYDSLQEQMNRMQEMIDQLMSKTNVNGNDNGHQLGQLQKT